MASVRVKKGRGQHEPCATPLKGHYAKWLLLLASNARRVRFPRSEVLQSKVARSPLWTFFDS